MKPRILLVDDHEDTRRLLSYSLGTFGYDVVVTDNTSDGLRLARQEQFDLFILDNLFEEGSGAELCKAIREFDSETPIIYFTGDHPTRLKDALDCPVQGVVMKPDFDKLKETVAETLRHV